MLPFLVLILAGISDCRRTCGKRDAPAHAHRSSPDRRGPMVPGIYGAVASWMGGRGAGTDLGVGGGMGGRLLTSDWESKLVSSVADPRRWEAGGGAPGTRSAPGSAFGGVPVPGVPASAATVLRAAGGAQPGSWTQRNVLQAGAADSMARRMAGNATEADFAVLGAARSGIASGASGPVSAAWSGAPWRPDAAYPDSKPLDVDAIGDAVAAAMFPS